ncbi:hypothetical protein FJZ33_03680, partial [Candidatus Poribacteria bacterium]|nr:hypothetical protein [Candidatus Poribacteria bacterium]
MNIRRAILTDANSRTSYYVAESLHREGLEIIGLNHSGRGLRSRAYQEIIPIPDFEQDPQTFKDVVNSFADNASIMIPVSLKAIRFLERNPNIFSDKLYLPKLNGDSFFLVKDKARCIEYMNSIGIPIPKTYFPDSKETAMDIVKQMDFPLVIKIRRETLISPEKRYAIVSNIHQFKTEYERLSNTQENPIIQEFVYGSGVGVSFLSDNGEILAIFSHRRLREDFITGGPSTYCEGFDSP